MKHTTIKTKIMLIATAFAVIYWFLEAALHSFVFHEGDFIQQIFSLDPNELWMRLFVVCLFVAFGLCARFIAGKLMKAGKTRRKSQEHYRMLAETMNDGLGQLDENGMYVYVNRKYGEIFGYSPDEMVGRHWTAFFDEDAQKIISEQLIDRKNGIAKSYEVVNTRRDGRRIALRISPQVILDEQGKFKGSFAILTDITERKTAELALAASEARYQDLYDNAPDMFVSVDAKTARILRCNQTAATATGYSKEEIIGRPVFDMYHPDCLDDAKKAFNSFATTGIVRNTELQLKKKDGSKMDITLNVSAVRDENGNILHSRSVWRDITDRKKAEKEKRDVQQRLIEQQHHEKERAEAELEKLRDDLVRTTRLAAIGQVSASIAHDLRNPLGTVRNASYFLRRRLAKDEPKAAEHLEIIDQEIAKADQIITNLLEMARPKTPQKQDVDLAETVKEVFGQAGQTEGVRCRTSLGPDPFVVRADPHQLRQAITNIVSNAVDAMRGQGEFLIEATRDSDYDTIVFQDTGLGFTQEVRERLFEPLVTTKAGGTGLGLTICRQIMEKHGGTIDAEDNEGRGAAIRIRLPRK